MKALRFVFALVLLLLLAPTGTLAAPNVGPADPLPAPTTVRPGRTYVSDTGHYLGGGFREFWQAHEGAFLLGLPLTEEFVEGGLTVQYFERGRMEHHPDYPAGQQVTLALLGASLNADRNFEKPAPFRSNANHIYFAETGYSLFGGFREFWQANGGLAMFGFPLSQEFKADDGYTHQLFERAEFVLYPEFAGTAYVVIPQPLGYRALAAAGLQLPLGTFVEMIPPQVQEGRTLLIRVHDQEGATVSGDWEGRTISFVPVGGGIYGGVAGEVAMGATGPHTIKLTVQRGATQRTVSRTVEVLPRDYPVDRVLLDATTSELLDPAITGAEITKINKVFAGQSGPPLWSGPFALPVPAPIRITALFGSRRAYNDGPVASFHGGMDIGVVEGTRVRAPAPGTVVLAERLQVRGNAVIVDHGGGVYTLYGHLSRIDVAVGQKVETGEVLALSGNTGLSNGPHLHWELHASGIGVDPLEWTMRSLP